MYDNATLPEAIWLDTRFWSSFAELEEQHRALLRAHETARRDLERAIDLCGPELPAAWYAYRSAVSQLGAISAALTEARLRDPIAAASDTADASDELPAHGAVPAAGDVADARAGA